VNQLIEIGVVARAHGLEGGIRVKLFAVDPEILQRLRRVVLRLPDGGEVEHQLVRVQPGSKGLPVVQLDRCAYRDEAEALRGALVLAARDELEPLEPDEFYLRDVVGCRAETPQGDLLGTVEEIGDNGAQSLLLIRRDQRIHNVPAVAPFIVDFDGQRLVLDLPDGLWDAVGHTDEK
jgi:16S rRNA processing protein RimM